MNKDTAIILAALAVAAVGGYFLYQKMSQTVVGAANSNTGGAPSTPAATAPPTNPNNGYASTVAGATSSLMNSVNNGQGTNTSGNNPGGDTSADGSGDSGDTGDAGAGDDNAGSDYGDSDTSDSSGDYTDWA